MKGLNIVFDCKQCGKNDSIHWQNFYGNPFPCMRSTHHLDLVSREQDERVKKNTKLFRTSFSMSLYSLFQQLFYS